MILRSWIKVAAVLIALVAGVSVYFAWRGAQREQAQLKAELQATQKALADADARQKTRDSELAELVAGFNEKKATIQKPEQIVKALPEVLPLPTPIILPTQPNDAGGQPIQKEGNPPADTASPKVSLPTEDLKPLYDFAVDCQECKAQLSAAQADLKDEQTKTQALSRERDSALKAARGGSTFRRIVRAGKWFVIGAAAGAVAAKLGR
jgi:hypothetical protein